MSGPAIYPTLPGIDIKVIWRPKGINYAPQVSASGREVIIGAAAYPLHEFELIYNALRQGSGPGYTNAVEFTTYLAFFMQVFGTQTGFRFTNPYDFKVTGNPTIPAQASGSNTDFVVARTISAGGFSGTEPVGYVNIGGVVPFVVYDNGTPKVGGGTDYTLIQDYVGGANDGRPNRQIIRFNTPPTVGHSITADATYDYWVRFSDDNIDFEQVVTNVFQIQRVKLQSIRAYGNA